MKKILLAIILGLAWSTNSCGWNVAANPVLMDDTGVPTASKSFG
jgi:hypothetical protein